MEESTECIEDIELHAHSSSTMISIQSTKVVRALWYRIKPVPPGASAYSGKNGRDPQRILAGHPNMCPRLVMQSIGMSGSAHVQNRDGLDGAVSRVGELEARHDLLGPDIGRIDGGRHHRFLAGGGRDQDEACA
jgi:hypothetical protein